MKSDDLWRCTECGNCTDNCRMDIDIASILHRLRQLEREYGSAIRCPERSAADTRHEAPAPQPRIDNMQFGMAMIEPWPRAQGHARRGGDGREDRQAAAARRHGSRPAGAAPRRLSSP